MRRYEVMLECHGLTKTYESADPPVQVLDGIDLEVRSGEFLVVMGASGSGKSTLLYSLSGMDRPTGGQVLLSGQDLTGLSNSEMSHLRLTTMGFVFQQAYLLPNLSLRDNILLPVLNAFTREVMKALNDINVEGTTIVMVTHDPACAVLADRVVYLRDGALAGEHNLGAWDSEDTGRRQEDLQNWLKGLGF